MHEVRFMSCFRSLFSSSCAHKKFICINRHLQSQISFVDVFKSFQFHSPCGSPSFLSLSANSRLIFMPKIANISVALHDRTRLLKSDCGEASNIKFLSAQAIINLARVNLNLIKKRFEASRFLAKTKLKLKGEADEERRKAK